MTYYTLQIHYGSSINSSIEELKDLNSEGQPEKIWRKELRRSLYTTGFEIQTAPGSWEWISPFRIHKVMFIAQPSKFGT